MGKVCYACLPPVCNCLLDATSFMVVVVTPLTDNERSGALINKNIVHVFRSFKLQLHSICTGIECGCHQTLALRARFGYARLGQTRI